MSPPEQKSTAKDRKTLSNKNFEMNTLKKYPIFRLDMYSGGEET